MTQGTLAPSRALPNTCQRLNRAATLSHVKLPAKDPPAIECADLRRSFPTHLGLRRKPVLRGIDLRVEPGTALALVGPNGSGKSTLLRLLAGIDHPSAGLLHIFGKSPERTAVRAQLAYLPEESPFPGELSAMNTMDLLGSLAGMSRKLRRTRGQDLLERVGLGAEARTPLKRFSRGMLRRFGLAQAFLNNPRLVLLDEPTAGLDAQGFSVVEDLFAEAREEGVTLVMASHILSDAQERCTMLAVLLDGVLACCGPPAELLGVGGRLAVEVEGLDDAALDRLTTWVGEQGGRVIARRPAEGSLLELYRKPPPDRSTRESTP